MSLCEKERLGEVVACGSAECVPDKAANTLTKEVMESSVMTTN